MQIRVDGIEKKVFLAEIVGARPPVPTQAKQPPAGYLSPVALRAVRASSKKAGAERFSVKSLAPQAKEKGKQAQILQLALTSCSVRFLEADRALTCQTSCYVSATEVTVIDTKSQILWLRSGSSIPAKISIRRLSDSERIIVNQTQLAANQAEAKQKAEADAAMLNAKIELLRKVSDEQDDALDKAHENPLGGKQAIVDYLLAADALSIKGEVAFAVLRVVYGMTQKKAAAEAQVSLKTIKRAVSKMKMTQYAKLFKRSRIQKREALKEIKNAPEHWSAARELAKSDPEKLRYIIEGMIIRAHSNNAEPEPQEEQLDGEGETEPQSG